MLDDIFLKKIDSTYIPFVFTKYYRNNIDLIFWIVVSTISKNSIKISFLSLRVAGTAGAVVTCPLEVVKTRLQSSNAFLPQPSSRPVRCKEISGIQSLSTAQSDALRRPEQRRKFSSTILRRIRPQVRKISLQINYRMNEWCLLFLLSLSLLSLFLYSRFRNYHQWKCF